MKSSMLVIPLLLFGWVFPLRAENTLPSLRVGVSAALSGPFSHFGTSVKNGITMAIEDHPDKFSNFRFEFQDDQYDPKQTIANFHLFQDYGVDLVFVAGVAPSEAVIPLAERYRQPLIVNCQRPSAAVGREFTIRFINYTGQYVATLLKELRSRGYKKLGLVVSEAPYIQGYVDALKDQLLPEESVTIVGSYQAQETEFRSVLARLSGYDAIGVFLFPGQVSSFYRQARNSGLTLPTFGTDVFESKNEIAAAQGAMEGAIYPFNPVDSEFVRRYQARFGNDEQVGTAANSYDFAMLVATRFPHGREHLNSRGIISRLRSTPAQSGVTGMFRFQISQQIGQYFEFPIVIKAIRGSEFVAIHELKNVTARARLGED